MAKPPKLYKHQKQSIVDMARLPRAIDMSDPGTGKTRVQIESFAKRRKHKGKKALIIAPKSLLKSAWVDDFKKYAPFVKVVIAPAAKRSEMFAQDADVYVTNTDATKWLAQQKPKFFEEFDTIIIDEISFFKHHTSQRSKALNRIKKHFKYRYGLTGTPDANQLTDLWHQVFIIDDGQRLGKSFYQFRNSVCQPVQVGPQPNMLKWEEKPGANQAVSTLIADICIRHKFEECMDIPANHEYSIAYDLPPKQHKSYLAMEKSTIVLFQDGKIASAVNGAVVMGKLLQISSGAVYTEDGTYSVVDTGRYELITDLVRPRDHTVVFFHWKHQRDSLIDEFEKAGYSFAVIDGTVSDLQRNQIVDDFQKGLYKVLLAQPQSAAHGLTLTKATTTIWASPTLNLEHWLQGNRRVYRATQTQKTETIVVIAENTIEQAIFDRLILKNARQLDTLDTIQAIFKDRV